MIKSEIELFSEAEILLQEEKEKKIIRGIAGNLKKIEELREDIVKLETENKELAAGVRNPTENSDYTVNLGATLSSFTSTS